MRIDDRTRPGSPGILATSVLLGGNPGRTGRGQVTNPTTYTALTGSTNPNAALVEFPIPPSPAEPYGTVQLDDSCRGTGCALNVYAEDRRVPYIQNMNLSIVEHEPGLDRHRGRVALERPGPERARHLRFGGG